MISLHVCYIFVLFSPALFSRDMGSFATATDGGSFSFDWVHSGTFSISTRKKEFPRPVPREMLPLKLLSPLLSTSFSKAALCPCNLDRVMQGGGAIRALQIYSAQPSPSHHQTFVVYMYARLSHSFRILTHAGCSCFHFHLEQSPHRGL